MCIQVFFKRKAFFIEFGGGYLVKVDAGGGAEFF